MDTVLIYCHPNDRNKENEILKIVMNELKHKDDITHVYNIIGDIFSSVITKHSSSLTDDKVHKIKTTINYAQQLIFLFPYYWNDFVPYIRRFAQEIMLGKNISPNETNEQAVDLHKHKALVLTSMAIPQLLLGSINRKTYNEPFTVSILKHCGAKNIKWYNLSQQLNNSISKRKVQKMREYLQSI